MRFPVDNSVELSEWLRLTLTPGVGPLTARQLLSAFGLPAQIFSASQTALRSIVSPAIAAALHVPVAPDKIQRALDWQSQAGNTILSLIDPAYPASLLNITDPPVLLYVRGDVGLLQHTALAVVGSRNATTQGIQNAAQFSDALGQAGLCIISGLALGIDAAAHQSGLRHPTSSVAVIGTGIDITYPLRNRELTKQLAKEGCIVSEYPLGTPPAAGNFPRRNRIISGLSLGVLVIEAAAQSGSLITARFAAEQGREVFAIPGSIHAPLAKGCHQLIQQGAKLVESAADILQELTGFVGLPRHPAVAPSEANNSPSDALLASIGFDPIHIESLAGRSGQDIAALSAELLPLELAGRIEFLPGGLIQRLA
jgi:DNA processing protein